MARKQHGRGHVPGPSDSLSKGPPRKSQLIQHNGTDKPAASGREYELLCFKLDRSIVARQLRKLWRTVTSGARDIELVAAEGVFDAQLSASLAQKAQSLQEMARELKLLHGLIIRAREPGSEASTLPSRRYLS